MQYISDDNEKNHIISEHSANKRLSFQGWEKCVEAFSQGKGNLSHRCIQLLPQSEMDTSHLDAAISWSSSEDESEQKTSQHTRHRPRQLSSEINFDNCKPTRERGRRRTSAVFMRSLEKRRLLEKCHKNHNDRNYDYSNSSPYLSNQQVTQPAVSSVQGKGSTVNSSESFEDHVWVKNLSMLNQRIDLSSDCSEGSENAQYSKENPSDKESQEDQITSSNLYSASNVGKSPIFKTIGCRKKRKLKAHQDFCPEYPALSGVSSKNSVSKSLEQKETFPSPKNEESLVSEGSVVLSPGSSKTEIPVSPVIGQSARRRRYAPKMLVNVTISPILGSKSKHCRTKNLQTSSHSSYMIRKERENNILSSKFSDLSDKPIRLCKTPISSSRECDSESYFIVTQNKISAKRALDFSLRNRPDILCASDCLSEEAMVTNVKNDSGGISNEKNNSFHDQISVDNIDLSHHTLELSPRKESPKTLGFFKFSHLIEEINTEQMNCDIVEDKTVKNPIGSRQKKKLKLSNKKPSSYKKENCPFPSSSKFNESAKTSSIEEFQYLKPTNNKQSAYLHVTKDKLVFGGCEKMKKSTKESLNSTLFIEEEFSEPMEAPPLDSEASVICSKDKNSCKKSLALTEFYKISSCIPGNTSEVEVDGIDIDSCSSQSLDQQSQIEKLPSSCLSSPLTISQSSSPPACAGQFALPPETIVDDFNAPRKNAKKKLKPDGLASRLHRLLNRQRSSSRIWQYQRSKQGKTTVVSESNSSMLVCVERTWTEYSHVIVQDVSGEKAAGCIDFPMNQVILVLDPYVAEKLGRIMSASKLQIFPPWQGLRLRGISLILCAYCIEVVTTNHLSSEKNVFESRKSEVSITLKEGFESKLGSSLTDIIFPTIVENSTRLFQYTEAIADEINESQEGCLSQGTISALVTSHYTGSAFADGLKLTILRIFHFNQSENKKRGDPMWSLLGQDFAKEVCEVVLGFEQSTTFKRSIWQDIKTGEAIGKTYSFHCFLPIQRISPFRVSNLWKIVSSMTVLGSCEQPVSYVLAAASSVWECHPIENERKSDIYQPSFTTLSSILLENSCESRRANIICRILHSTNERAYVTDVGMFPTVIHITISQSAYLSPCISKTAVIAMLDLEVVSGDLKADKYTRISAVSDKNFSNVNSLFSEENFWCLANLNPDLPILQWNTSPRTLVMFCGTVIGVDEDSAFMWPACGICENELLSLGDGTEKYHCEKCNDQSESFVSRMSLQVLCTSPNLPQHSSICLKLLQRTIESLLPSPKCEKEGYDMNGVLGQKLGPLRCEVLHSKDSSFTLQEVLDRVVLK